METIAFYECMAYIWERMFLWFISEVIFLIAKNSALEATTSNDTHMVQVHDANTILVNIKQKDCATEVSLIPGGCSFNVIAFAFASALFFCSSLWTCETYANLKHPISDTCMRHLNWYFIGRVSSPRKALLMCMRCVCDFLVVVFCRNKIRSIAKISTSSALFGVLRVCMVCCFLLFSFFSLSNVVGHAPTVRGRVHFVIRLISYSDHSIRSEK